MSLIRQNPEIIKAAKKWFDNLPSNKWIPLVTIPDDYFWPVWDYIESKQVYLDTDHASFKKIN